jgi:Tfp pilus assembly protein PilF/exonuclease VII small subunit
MAGETIDSLCQKARQNVAQGNYDQARQFYLQALGLRSDIPDVHYGLATVCFLLNDLPSAAYHFKEVTRLDPLRAGAFINLGAVYNRLEQFDDAIPVLRRGIQLDTHRGEGYYNLGLVHRRKGQVDLAIEAYREATRVNPRMADAHYNLANLYLEKEKYNLAVFHYRKTLELRAGWDKAEHGLEQAEAALAAQGPTMQPTALIEETKSAAPSSGTVAILDPEKTVDPTAQGGLLSNLHKATIDSETQARNFHKILEAEIEPAIKELSTCLLYPDSSATELDESIQKFETAVASMRSAQRNLQSSLDRVRNLGEKLLGG